MARRPDRRRHRLRDGHHLRLDGRKALDAPVVGIASTATGKGYDEVASDGGVFSFGDAQFHGSMGGKPLNAPIVGMAVDQATGGYWLVAADGGVFSFTAPFLGSMGGTPLDQPVVGMAAMPTGTGYWLVAADGGVFAFGAAAFHGSMGGQSLNAPIVGMAPDPATGGYWEVASDGGVFAFDAPFYGSEGSRSPSASVAGLAVTPTGAGYTVVDAAGAGTTYGARPSRRGSWGTARSFRSAAHATWLVREPSGGRSEGDPGSATSPRNPLLGMRRGDPDRLIHGRSLMHPRVFHPGLPACRHEPIPRPRPQRQSIG